MILRALAAAAVIALLAIAWLALNGETSGPSVPATATVSAESPGYSARDAVLIETGADGLPMYTLRAAQMREQPASRVALLDQVAMQFRDTDGQLWNGRADRARVVDQSSRNETPGGAAEGVDRAAQVELAGHVALSGLLPGNPAPIRISTDRLNVDTHSEIVRTADEVTIDWGAGQLQARGLTAWLREQRIQLGSHVRGQYAH